MSDVCECRSEPSDSIKMLGISWLAEDLLGFQEEPYYMKIMEFTYYLRRESPDHKKDMLVS